MAFWKESMINRLSNLINRNRSAAKISQVLCSIANTNIKTNTKTITNLYNIMLCRVVLPNTEEQIVAARQSLAFFVQPDDHVL